MRIFFYMQRFLNIAKIKATYWWWVIKYGGKRNIPPEVIFGALEKTMEELAFDVEQAFRSVQGDASLEEREFAAATFSKIRELHEELDRTLHEE